jgi:hypothetical protein
LGPPLTLARDFPRAQRFALEQFGMRRLRDRILELEAQVRALQAALVVD